MRVCYIYQEEYPWDIRVNKIVNSLADAEIEAHVICRNRTGVPEKECPRENVYIHRLSKRIGAFGEKILSLPAFFSPFWFRLILSTVNYFGISLIIVRDLPLAPTAYWVGRLTKRPVLIDMAENYPAMIIDTWTYRGPYFFDYIIRNPFLLRIMENWVIRRMDGIFVVSNASKARVEKKLRNSQKQVWVVGNTPRLRFSWPRKVHPIMNTMRNHQGLVCFYVGGLEAVRGLETAIKAIALVDEKISILFVIVGMGDSQKRLQRMTVELGIEDRVIFAGWIDNEYIPSITTEADVCIVPHYVTENIDTTLPNKLFDYMAQGKPVIVTNSKSLAEIVNMCRCGLVYQDKNPKELAEAITKLADAGLRKRLGEAGLKAVMEKYNWSVDEKKLLFAISSFRQP